MITIEMPELCARFTRIVLQRRVDEIHEYHTNHPELPRQDDVLATYLEALKCLEVAGVPQP